MPKLTAASVAAERPQPHVDSEYVAIGGHLVEQCDQAAREADEIFMIAQWARAARLAVPGYTNAKSMSD
jgi:hypothetical protein